MTGITGQDGSYLAELLLEAGYEVYGLVRSKAADSSLKLQAHLGDLLKHQTFHLREGVIEDTDHIASILGEVRPDEVYHLAAQSHVGLSFEQPVRTCDTNGTATIGMLEAIRQMEQPAKFLHASSSEVFGTPAEIPQTAATPMRPISPYGVSKAYASQMVCVYREHYGLFACNAFCYNHESPRRSDSFVTRKITQAAAQIKLGKIDNLPLGNLESERDWGYAPDFVRGFYQLMTADIPQDVVLGTGQKHSVKDWLDVAFDHVGLDWTKYVTQDPRFMRKSDPCLLVGDPKDPQSAIGWSPSTSFEAMVREMVDADLR